MIKKNNMTTNILFILMSVYAVICLYPMIWMVFYSLKNNEEIFVTNPFGPPLEAQWENYQKAVTQFDILLYFRNSVIVSALAIILGIMAVLMFTYVVSRVRTKLTNTMRMVVMAGMFIPIQAVMIPLVVMVKNLNLANTHWSLIIPYIALSFPFAVMILYSFFINIPIVLEESAFMEGSGFFNTFFKIILPQMSSAISVLVIYQFMTHWNEFNLALVLITKTELKTLPLGLAGFYGQFSTEWGPVGASLVIASLPVIIAYIFFSDKISSSVVLSGVKG